MQINPLNLIIPLADIPVITPAPAVGARNRADTTQAGSDHARAPIQVKPKAGEIKVTFPPERTTDVEEVLHTLEEAVQEANITLNFSRDEETGVIVVKLVDQASGETVQQIPAEALLHLSAALGKLQGQLFDQTA
jgi:flagellar protein FlaG